MAEDSSLSGGSALDENARRAKADWLKVDPERLRDFIAGQPDVRSVDILKVEYPSKGAGSSNGIAYLRADIDVGPGPARRQLVVRYAPGRTLIKQKNFNDEFLTGRAVHAAGLPAAEPLWIDPHGERLGVKGYVMERVFGDVPSAGMLNEGLLARASPADRNAMMLEAAGFHGRLRRANLGPSHVPHLLARGIGRTPLERELRWWLEEAELNCAPEDSKLARIRRVFTWLLEHQPTVRPATLVHGDSQLSNLMFREGEVVAALDWELAYLGHGEADLALMIWMTEIQKQFAGVNDVPSEQDYIARYEAESGAPVEHWEYFRLFLLYKLVSVLMASAATMPSFDTFWEFNWAELERSWQRCRAGAAP
jgi:aminoglycoside phosphotransferase (APT) family kinase protein